MRVLLKYQKDLMMKEGLLYRKVLWKGQDQPMAQFELPKLLDTKHCWHVMMILVIWAWKEP